MARSKAVSYTRDLAVANQLGCGTTVWNAYPYMAWWWSHGLPLVVGFPMTCLPYVQMAQHTRTTPHRWSTCPPQSTCAVPSAISSRLPPGPLPDRSSPSGAPSSLARRARLSILCTLSASCTKTTQRQVLGALHSGWLSFTSPGGWQWHAESKGS